jgi:cell shape-determining protein MreC
MDFLEKLRRLPEFQRKLILWSIVIIIAFFLFIFWIRQVKEQLASFKSREFQERFQLPKIDLPSLNFPNVEISDDEKKQLLEQLKQHLNKEGLSEKERSELSNLLERLLENGKQPTTNK